MVTRVDPARTGVRAGRVVGLLTAGLAVATLVADRGAFREATTLLLDLVGVDPGLSVTALFWGNVALAAAARYSACYVVGSLLGVVYDWIDRPSTTALAGLVLAVGLADGALAALDARSALVGAAYLLAWLCYVPVFAYLFDEDAGDARSGPRRLGAE
jgi:hypothetical protein